MREVSADFIELSADVQLFSLSGKQTQEAAGKAAERMQAVAQSSTTLVRGFQEVSRAVFEMTQNRFQKNVEALTALSRCRSVPEFLTAQASLVRDNVDLTLGASRTATNALIHAGGSPTVRAASTRMLSCFDELKSVL